VAAALNRGSRLPDSLYEAGVDALGEQGMAEIIFLVGCFHLIGIILNGYDVSVPNREDGIVI
jgi:4-carboxymuconolactone decarboxylase